MAADGITITSLAIMLIPAFIVGIVSFIIGMYVFKAKSETKAEARDLSVDKDLLTIQKDVARLEVRKVDKERLDLLYEDIKRLDNSKADREIVTLMQEQVKEIGSNVMEILRRLSP